MVFSPMNEERSTFYIFPDKPLFSFEHRKPCSYQKSTFFFFFKLFPSFSFRVVRTTFPNFGHPAQTSDIYPIPFFLLHSLSLFSQFKSFVKYVFHVSEIFYIFNIFYLYVGSKINDKYLFSFTIYVISLFLIFSYIFYTFSLHGRYFHFKNASSLF